MLVSGVQHNLIYFEMITISLINIHHLTQLHIYIHLWREGERESEREGGRGRETPPTTSLSIHLWMDAEVGPMSWLL